jgi:hypothetical protein
MTWSLDYVLDPKRKIDLALAGLETPRFDGTSPGDDEQPRQVRAGAQLAGGPGRELDAAQAWAFELGTYFRRGIEGQPQVMYAGGVYTVIGPIRTTHPGDHPDPRGVVWFT